MAQAVIQSKRSTPHPVAWMNGSLSFEATGGIDGAYTITMPLFPV
jgi:hypothetical protein